MSPIRGLRDWPDELRTLTTAALDNGEMGAARKALRRLSDLPEAERGFPFALGLCSTFVIQPQLPMVELALAAEGLRPRLLLGEMDNIEQSLLVPTSALLAGNPDAVLVLWRLEDLAPALAFEGATLGRQERRRIIDGLIGRAETLVAEYGGRAPLFLSLLPTPSPLGPVLADLHAGEGSAAAVAAVNAAILRLAAESDKIHVFDLAGWAAGEGRAAFSRKMDLVARQPIAAVPSFARRIARTLRPLTHPRAKVLALDLDNTLWGGVLGEDGVAGLKIGHDFPGNVYRRIQQFAKTLKAQGVVLVLLSKNNLAEVEAAFADLPDMPLRLDDFAMVKADWSPKYENLKAAITALNVGIDSVVFVDDQAFEREQMEFSLPQVEVLPTTGDPLSILEALLDHPGFDALKLSREDLARSEDYASQSRREELERRSSSMEDFLHGLQLKAVVEPLGKANLGRAVQMLAKTNQFNLTNRRHGEAGLSALMVDPRSLSLVVSLSDRFADQGIVGLMLGVPVSGTVDSIEIDSFVISCRSLGRDLERLMWAEMMNRAQRAGYKVVTARYLPTTKNGQVAELYDRLGMTAVSRSEAGTEYRLDLPGDFARPEWITLTRTDTPYV